MTTSVFEIPLIAAPQAFSISIGNTTYNMDLAWNTVSENWVLDISDLSNNPLIQGIPLITGADLLEQYAYVGLGVQLYAQTDNAPGVVPTYDNLGIDSHLYFAVVS